jgi:hypothetical protein
MATDIARRSFDPARHYTSVVSQQGRVSLEAEENEDRAIASDERRKEIIDIVGPAGTPDDGYAISPAGPGDFIVGPGTMYVGGIRVELDAPENYSDQRDWLDHDTDPDWRPVVENPPPFEHVLLVLREHDVTATEDPMLREVALGGPDGAARSRILQHVERRTVKGATCSEALREDLEHWTAEGLTFDPKSMELQSDSRLLVSWDGPPEPVNPCEPGQASGYLGAENQAIRIKIVAVDEKGALSVLWGWDNASFLYRATTDGGATPTLTLDRAPVDAYHQPRTGQAVEVLRAAADLDATDGVVEGWVAALDGQFGLLSAPYNPDQMTVQFPAALPTQYTDPKDTSQLFLRVWEGLLTGIELGARVSIPGTGISLTFSTASQAIHIGDFWTLGLRPLTPEVVLPDVLLRQAQPPDGPRQWACPLAVIGWSTGTVRVVDDCRWHFPPLVGVTGAASGCCTVSVGPSDVERDGLQAIIDKAVASRGAPSAGTHVTVCLRPGVYTLAEPLVLETKHSHLTIEGCGNGAVLEVAGTDIAAFKQGVIVAVHTNYLTIGGVVLHLPLVPADLAQVRPGGLEPELLHDALGAVFTNRWISIGIRPVHCAQLTITDCEFRFELGPGITTPEVAQTMPRTVMAAGVFAGSECWGLRLEHNRFLHEELRFLDLSQGPTHLLVGFLLSNTALFQAPARKPAANRARRLAPTGIVIRSLLHDAVMRNNIFDGLTAAVDVIAELGTITVEDNVVRNCRAGISFMSSQVDAYVDLVGTYEANPWKPQVAAPLQATLTTAAIDPGRMLTSVLGRTFPLPAGFEASGRDLTTAEEVAESEASHKDQAAWMQSVLNAADTYFRDPASASAKPASKESPPAGAVQPAAQPPAPAAAAEPSTPAAAAPAGSFTATSKDVTAGAATDTPLVAAHAVLSAYEQSVAVTPGKDRLELRVSANNIDCSVGGHGGTGAALEVWDMGRGTLASVMVDENRCTSDSQAPAVRVLRVTNVSMTGNIVRNAQKGGSSALVLPASRAVAITGNIFGGTAVLPVRPLPAPFDDWGPLNTEFT